MKEKTCETMSSAEFEALLDKTQEEEFGDLTTDQFFTALGSLREDEALETLELAATVKDGQLVFEEPAPLYAHANELRVGGKRILIRLVETEQDAA
ncbi:MAG TPA: hypothetical protein VKU00_15325 [Chthonomonadaceae bacterium]|nr:hypothetical protein [Chthonomonadaceae bacterium]